MTNWSFSSDTRKQPPFVVSMLILAGCRSIEFALSPAKPKPPLAGKPPARVNITAGQVSESFTCCPPSRLPVPPRRLLRVQPRSGQEGDVYLGYNGPPNGRESAGLNSTWGWRFFTCRPGEVGRERSTSTSCAMAKESK